jgi:hypothetical protein
MIAGTPMQVGADRIHDTTVDKLKDSPQGYSSVVCSVWINDSDPLGTAKYSTFDAPTGHYFHLIQIYSQDASAEQSIEVRFWASSTDSTTILAAVDTVWAAANAYQLEQAFPIKCYKMSVTGIAVTEDWKVIGYSRDH